MGNEENWRTPTDATDYFTRQSKKLSVADRRPVIRNASDLGLGPGFAAQAVRISDFNDILATYNGFFSAVIGAANAPALGDFVGTTVMDSVLGGTQRFTSLQTGIDFKRIFRRNPSDAESISWGAWQTAATGVPIGAVTAFGGSVAPEGWLICNGSSYSTGLYPALYAVIGYTFGGSGSVFNVPDLRDRTVYGAGSAWGSGTTEGLAAGSRTMNLFHSHNIITTMAPDHSHSISAAPPHNHGGGGTTGEPTGINGRGNGTIDTPGPGHRHTYNIPDGGVHDHGAASGPGGGHYHGGGTWDDLTDGPLLRGVGMNWIIKHAA